jgi:hypothetical protein
MWHVALIQPGFIIADASSRQSPAACPDASTPYNVNAEKGEFKWLAMVFLFWFLLLAPRQSAIS